MQLRDRTGKTTTTSIIAKTLLKVRGRTVHLGGNIGRALLPIIEEINEEDVAVVELSSFQLISMTTIAGCRRYYKYFS